jgi:hypothetical protein
VPLSSALIGLPRLGWLQALPPDALLLALVWATLVSLGYAIGWMRSRSKLELELRTAKRTVQAVQADLDSEVRWRLAAERYVATQPVVEAQGSTSAATAPAPLPPASASPVAALRSQATAAWAPTYHAPAIIAHAFHLDPNGVKARCQGYPPS